MTSSHDDRVQFVAQQMTARPVGSKITIRKSTPSHSVRDPGYKAACHRIDVSGLTEILSIDTKAHLAKAEGQVLIDDLSKATLVHGLLPAVVPEYRKFTVAGLVSGEGIQSSSHLYGVFTQTVDAVELLQADGAVINASAVDRPEIFEALPESLGTLGIVTAVTIRLVPAKAYVKLTYRRFTTLQDYIAAYRDTLEWHAFHEGVIFGPRTWVLITGDFVDGPGDLNPFDPWEPGGPYFYQHVKERAAANATTSEVVETLAYLSRSERGFWWMAECHADFPLLTETAWGRRRLDKTIAEAYNKLGFASTDLTPLEGARCLINQDMGVTLERLGEGIEWVQQHLGVYPIWNCAVHLSDRQRGQFRTSHLVDIGIYGEPMAPGYRHVRDLRALQKRVESPSLWGISYLTWEEIQAANPARIERYNRARSELNADEAFLHIKDKVVWVNPSATDEGKIPFWRLYRSFGPRWFLNPAVYPLLVVAFLSRLVWPRAAAK